MNIRRMATLAAALVLAVASTAVAQGGGGRGFNLERMKEQVSLKAVMKDITLAEAQQKTIDGIEAKYAKQFDTMFEEMRVQIEAAGGPPDREAMRARREKMDKVQTEEYDEVRAVLSAEQKTTFEKNIEERRAARAQRRPNG